MKKIILTLILAAATISFSTYASLYSPHIFPHEHINGNTAITSIADLIPFRGQIVAYTTNEPGLKINPNASVQYAVVTDDATSDQCNFASDIFPLVAPGIENFDAFSLNTLDLNTAQIIMRHPTIYEYQAIFYLLICHQRFFSCDLFEFEQNKRTRDLALTLGLR